jgi:hypothetical protein
LPLSSLLALAQELSAVLHRTPCAWGQGLWLSLLLRHRQSCTRLGASHDTLLHLQHHEDQAEAAASAAVAVAAAAVAAAVPAVSCGLRMGLKLSLL